MTYGERERIRKAYILPEPMKEIEKTVAQRRPESGGILLGPPDRDLISVFIFDEHGSRLASGAHYTPHISSLQRAVDEVHRNRGYIIKGFVHSHPGSMSNLSFGDLDTIRKYFDGSDPLPYFFAPIVWSAYHALDKSDDANGDWDFKTDRRLAFHVIHPEDKNPDLHARTPLLGVESEIEVPISARPYRSLAGSVKYSNEAPTTRETPVTVTVRRCKIDMQRMRQALGASEIRELMAPFSGHELYSIEAQIEGAELLFIFPAEFPIFPPHIQVTPRSGPPFKLTFAWSIATSERQVEEKLARVVDEHIKKKVHALGPDPKSYRFGPAEANVVCTSDPVVAREQGWVSHNALMYEPHDIQEEYFARSGGILSRSLVAQEVLIVGCGSGGSYIAEQLVRSGLGGVVLCDPDVVKYHNLCRSGFTIADIELPKVNALARRLRNINPHLRTRLLQSSAEKIHEDAKLADLIQSVDLVIAGTDTPEAQRMLGRYSYMKGVPALFPGLYERAQGGEVLLTWPNRSTPCYHCLLGFRGKLGDEGERLRGSMDYSTGTLIAEPGLSADIHHLDSITIKLALGLLLQGVPDEKPCEARDFVRGMVKNGESRTYVLTCHAPAFWIFGKIYEPESSEARTSYAYQSLWLDVTKSRKHDCETCGERPRPLDAPLIVDLDGIGGMTTLSDQQIADLTSTTNSK